MKIKINVDGVFDGHSKGDVIEVDDVNGVPTLAFWRRRLRDSVFDKCCEIVGKGKNAAPAEEAE